jgi:hypothetical protein
LVRLGTPQPEPGRQNRLDSALDRNRAKALINSIGAREAAASSLSALKWIAAHMPTKVSPGDKTNESGIPRRRIAGKRIRSGR